MLRAAGVLFLVGESALFLRRGNGSDHPNEWCTPGGQLEGDETAIEGAIRETAEECGFECTPEQLRLWTRTVALAETSAEQAIETLPAVIGEAPAPSQDVDFTTFICRLPEQFTPVLALDEHDGYAWAPVTAPPQPVHPSVQIALDRLNMDELGVARAIASGRIASPQKYENVWLFAIRITGTGVSYRHARKEYVWRNPEVYMNDDFLARCNGLAVIWEHPEKSLLNSKEFSDRVVGSVFLPYLRPELQEVWAVAKIYDEEAVEGLRANQLSTSPAVNFGDPLENEKIRLEDGKVMLLEGTPSLLDHIAICPAGVWDKGGDPTGVEALADRAPKVYVLTARRSGKVNMLRAHAAALALKATVAAAI